MEVEIARPVIIAVTEEVGLAVPVAGRDEALQSEIVEVVEEVAGEVLNARIIAVAEDRLPLERGFVVSELVLDIRKLRVELVLLGLLSLIQIPISHLPLLKIRFTYSKAYLGRMPCKEPGCF